eukprot:XP_765977.1 hypothetical protein [Theileria parva strain Muguga]
MVEPESATKIKSRRDLIDNMFNEGFDSIFSNIDHYKSDSTPSSNSHVNSLSVNSHVNSHNPNMIGVNPFGTPNRALENSFSKSPKKSALVMKSFRWDHSQAKPELATPMGLSFPYLSYLLLIFYRVSHPNGSLFSLGTLSYLAPSPSPLDSKIAPSRVLLFTI